MAVTLSSHYVPEDQDEAFQKNWKKTSETFSPGAGFIETHVYSTGPASFRYVNVALWETRRY
jgi:heme-degrading monooxygenase HmoA